MALKLPKGDVLDALLDVQSSGEEEDDDEENVLYRSLEDILNDSDDEEDTGFADMESNANNCESDAPREINLGNSQQLDESLCAVSETFDLYNSSSQEVNDAVLQKESIFASQVTQNLEIESRKSLYAISSLLAFGSNNPKPGAALAAAASVSRQQNGKHPASIPLTRESSVRQDGFELNVSHHNNTDQLDDRELQNFDAEVLHSVDVGKVVFSIEKPEELKARVSEIPETLQVESKVSQDGEAAELEEGAIGEFDQLESCSDKCQDSDERVLLDMQIEKLTLSGTEESNLDAVESNYEIDDLQVKRYSDQSFGEQSSECQMCYISSRLDEVIGKDTEEEADIKERATFQSHSQVLGSLHNAEDQERLAASFRSNWEVGAAAQPMRLEGIHQNTPAVGLLQTRTKRPLLHSLASPAMRRDHGSPLTLAVHMNFLAIGMSRGTILVSPNKHSATRAKENEETKALFLGNASDKAQVGTTALCFNHSADMLLSGFSNGSLTLWDLPKVSVAKVISGEHNAAVVHVAFVGRSLKAITADCKGVVLVHTFTMVPLLRRFSVMTQRLLDGQHTGIVLGLSSLVPDEYSSNSTQLNTGNTFHIGLGSTGTISAAGNDAGKKILYDGNLANEAKGMVVLVTRKVALVVQLGPSVEVCAKLERPQGIDEWSVPYAAWRRPEMNSAPNGTVKSDNLSTMTKKSLDGGENVLEGSSENGAIEDERAPILALVWGRKVLITQLLKAELNVTQLLKAELKVLTAWDLDRVAVGIGWLNEQILIVCTANVEVLLFTKEGIKLEEVCIDSARDVIEPMVYHTHYINSIGNPEKAYHNSFGVRGAEVFLLQPHGLWTARLLPWQDRIAVLQEAGDWLGAFHVAMELYDGKAKGVTGLPRGMVTMQEAIMPTLMSLLSAYIDEAFAYISLTLGPSSQQADLSNKKSIIDGQPLESRKAIDALEATKEQYARVGGVAIEFCLHIGRTDILFQNVFQKFETVGRKDVFLELLEPYILKDMLHGLAPEIMQCLVEHYSSKGWLQRVEQCILHMDITSLDFNQVVKLCREHGLFSALTYLFNKGLDDYTSPLEELLAVAQDSEKPNAQAFGYKLLVYLRYCFLGLAFPPGRGVIEQSLLPALRAKLVEYLIDPEGVPRASKVSSTEVVSVRPYARIMFLLKLDAAATLHVLKLAFIEDEALSADEVHLGLANYKAFNIDPVNFITNGTFLIQSVIDAFVHIVETVPCERLDMEKDKELSDVGSNGSTNSVYEDAASLSVSEAGQLFEFIASFLASGYGSVPKRSFLRILHHLASEGLGVQDRENLMVAMLIAVPGSDWDANDVLQIAEQAKFWQVIALIFRQKGDYKAALSSYMKDNSRPLQPFKFILQVLEDDIPVTDLAKFRELVLAQYLQLAQLSSEAACVLVLKHFSQQNDLIVGKLKPHPEVLFKYLKTMIDIHSSSIDMQKIENDVKYREDIDNIANILSLVDVKGEQINSDNRSRLAKLLWQSRLEISDDLIELYLELLCQFKPSLVLQFLQKFENYRLEYCLKLCQEYHVNDAAAFLLERVGDVGSAVSLILKDLEMHLHKMKEAVMSIPNSSRLLAENKKQTIFKIPEVVSVYSILDSAVAICQRNTLRLDQREAEGLWFHLLDRFASFLHTNLIGFKSSSGCKVIMHKHRDTETCAGVIVLRQLLSKFTGDIINGMIGYVPAHIIMNKLLFKHGNHEFADFKGSILEILSLYGYELAILGTAKKVIENETFLNIMTLKRRYSQGYVVKFSYCCLCEKVINERADEYASKLGVMNKETYMKEVGVRIFCCGHVVHIACMETVNSDVAMQCPICLQRNVTGLFSMDKRKCAQEHVKSNVFSSNKYQENMRRQMVQASNSLEPSRFELLKDLQSRESSDGLLLQHSLKLSPPSQRPRLRSKYIPPLSTKSTPSSSTSWTAKFPSIRALSNIGGSNYNRQK